MTDSPEVANQKQNEDFYNPKTLLTSILSPFIGLEIGGIAKGNRSHVDVLHRPYVNVKKNLYVVIDHNLFEY